jgi:hypothetical protein
MAVATHNTSNPSQAHQKGIQKCFLNQLLIKVKTVAGTFLAQELTWLRFKLFATDCNMSLKSIIPVLVADVPLLCGCFLAWRRIRCARPTSWRRLFLMAHIYGSGLTALVAGCAAIVAFWSDESADVYVINGILIFPLVSLLCANVMMLRKNQSGGSH